MACDKYASFAELEKSECIGVDFRISSCYRDSRVAIVALHGGKIESGTAEICTSIAKDDLSYYIFFWNQEEKQLLSAYYISQIR